MMWPHSEGKMMLRSQLLYSAICIGCLFLLGTANVAAQTTAFTYQGQLQTGGVPVSGAVDLQFKLFNGESAGAQIGSTIIMNDQIITAGLLTVTLDFGGGAFDGSDRWLQIETRPGTETGSYTVLAPRQKITPVPYAIFAQKVPWSGLGGVPASIADGVDNDTTYTAGLGLTLSGTTFSINTAGASTGQALTFNGGNLVWTTPATTLALPFSATGSTLVGSAFRITNSSTANDVSAISGTMSAADAGDSAAVSGYYRGTGDFGAGVYGYHIGTGAGVRGESPHGIGVSGASDNMGVGGYSSAGTGVVGTSDTGTGVYGHTGSGNGYAGYFEGPAYFSGYVGIGTTKPLVPLHVEATSGNPALLATNRGTGPAATVTSGYGTALVVTGSSDSDAAAFIRNLGNGPALEVPGTARVGVLQITGGSDLSEGFEIDGDNVRPGMVVAIDPQQPGRLRPAAEAYDRKVAGIISGAGDIKPGMIMGQSGSLAAGKYPVALTGRVYCLADASTDAIAPGDLLTTSATSGHAMKVIDHDRAQGAVIGKAMTGLAQGQTGMVLTLVTLE